MVVIELSGVQFISQFKYFINTILSRFEIKFIHFLGGNNTKLERKVAKFAT